MPPVDNLAFLAQTEAGLAWLDKPTIWLFAGAIVVLLITSLIGWILSLQPETVVNPGVVRILNNRVQSWWFMCSVLTASFLLGAISTSAGLIATLVLFGVLSFWALREYITMTPTRRGDHRSLFWIFFLITPLQYVLISWELYGAYTVVIPVYASLFIPARNAISGDPKRFLERSAKIQMGLMICVYCLSHAPAILHLQLRTRAESTGGAWTDWNGSPAGLLFYFILVVQFADVFQYAWGKLLGRRVIAPDINASKTWEGFLGGVATATLAGGLLWWVTPFTLWGSMTMSAVIAVVGLAGGLTMSAIKRDRGVKDYGTLVQGHAGLLDRIDSLCFAAPVFFHLTKYFHEIPPA